MRLTQPIKWHGGKRYLARKIVALMPTRCWNPAAPDPADPGWLHYVEPYAGGLSVLLANDPEEISEVVNDLDGRLINFWKCLADPSSFHGFCRRVSVLPLCEEVWEEATFRLGRPCDRPNTICVTCAVAFFICCRQSLAGRMKGFTALTRNRTRRGMNGNVSEWLGAVEGLPAVHQRLRSVAIVGPRPALDVIRREDGPRTLFYLDPPYLHETRATTGEYGPNEMSEGQHGELLDALGSLAGRFLLSGYQSELYDAAAKKAGWNCHQFNLPNHAASGNSKRRMTECVWANF
jgi:DNA adenine methylase